MPKQIALFLFGLFLLIVPFSLYSQTFVEVQNSPITNPNLLDYWTGVAWVDIDNDSDLDLFLTNRLPGNSPRQNKLFLNQNGSFVLHNGGDLTNDFGFWFGNSWGDINNDSLIDVYVAGYPARLYLNQGGGTFSRVSQGTIGSAQLAGIGAAMGDLNQDGNLDIILVRPNWIAGPPSTGIAGSPSILINDGAPNYSFTLDGSTEVSLPNNDTYLNPTLSDFDNDGDLDLFIGMGSGASKPDLLYENIYADSLYFGFKRLLNHTLANDSVEGNQWSFADVDNDLDLDAYLTNWANVVNGVNNPRANNLYLNQGGNFTKVNRAHITTDLELTTTVCWGDYDNDKDLDAITVSDRNYTLSYYQNDGNGMFTAINAGGIGGLDKHQSGATNGDFDNDGDLDLYIPGPDTNSSFFRNDLSNSYNWVQFDLLGTVSNCSGIGSKVYVKSGGSWQMRETSASSTFFGMNALRQHFGLANDTIEEVRVKWPSGIDETFYNLTENHIHQLVEGNGTLSMIREHSDAELQLFVFPNPNHERFKVLIQSAIPKKLKGSISIIDTSGTIRFSKAYQGELMEFNQGETSLPAGNYLLRFISDDQRSTATTKLIIN